VFPDSNLFDAGYATLDTFFDIAPWVFLLLIPAITMRSFSEEFKGGTFEILQTKPLTKTQVILGKYFASLLIVLVAILPTLVYVFTIDKLSTGGIDAGGIAGSYIGYFFWQQSLQPSVYVAAVLQPMRGCVFIECICLLLLFSVLFPPSAAYRFFSRG
jgi:ABC-type transport system involved in multi-copper enzyme maturation permease subunit